MPKIGHEMPTFFGNVSAEALAFGLALGEVKEVFSFNQLITLEWELGRPLDN